VDVDTLDREFREGTRLPRIELESC
jgi:hypothetical protein